MKFEAVLPPCPVGHVPADDKQFQYVLKTRACWYCGSKIDISATFPNPPATRYQIVLTDNFDRSTYPPLNDPEIVDDLAVAKAIADRNTNHASWQCVKVFEIASGKQVYHTPHSSNY